MKKTIILVMLFVLAFGAIQGVMAETVKELDMASYTNEEIAELYEKIQIEIVRRGIGKTAMFARGTYTIGEGSLIPAGAYTLKSIPEGDNYGIFYVRTPNDPEDEYPSKMYEFADEDDHLVVYLYLEEGDTLYATFAFSLTMSVEIGVFK